MTRSGQSLPSKRSWREEINSLVPADFGGESGQGLSLSTTTELDWKNQMWPLLFFGLYGLALGYLIGRYASSKGGTDG